jgi:hypothetical protein
MIYEKNNNINKPNLKKRIIDMLNPHIQLFGFNRKQKNRIISNIIDSRHYYTHFDNKLKEKVINKIDLFTLSNFLKWLLIVCLLVETGFSYEKAHDIISRNQSFINFKHVYLKKYYPLECNNTC